MRTGTWRVAVVLAVIVVLTVTGGLGPWSLPALTRMVVSYLGWVVLVGVPLFFIVRAAIISAARELERGRRPAAALPDDPVASTPL